MIGTGKGLRIAVVDSGVNLRHPHIVARTRRVVFTPDAHGEDLLGHGTAVMAAIQERAPEAEYWALKIFSGTLRTSTARLTAALEWAIGNKMDIINLSLGTGNLQARDTLQTLVDRARAQGTLVISARTRKDRSVLPGSLDGVLGVEEDREISRDSYRVGGSDMRVWASGYPRPLPGLRVDQNLSGISFAVANMTGFAARVYEKVQPRTPVAVYAALCANLQLLC
jgi:subtilisin family serine protease